MIITIIQLDPPGQPTLTLTQTIWIENNTYMVSCRASSGNPSNIYTWYLDDVYVHTGDSYIVKAAKGQQVIRCNVSNTFTKNRNLYLSDEQNLNVHCKIEQLHIQISVISKNLNYSLPVNCNKNITEELFYLRALDSDSLPMWLVHG